MILAEPSIRSHCSRSSIASFTTPYGERAGRGSDDDFQTCPGETSLILEIGSASLPELDWTIVRVLDRPETLPALFEDLYEFDPRRAGRFCTLGRRGDHVAGRPARIPEPLGGGEKAMAELCALGIRNAARRRDRRRRVCVLRRDGREARQGN